MGFTTGFLGGLTLTYSAVYLSVYVHRQNRTHQSLLLRQQAKLLNSKVDGPEPEYAPPAYRMEDGGIEEQFKDKWNRSIQKVVSSLQNTDWEKVRIDTEHTIGDAWKNFRSINADNAAKTTKSAATETLSGKRLLEEK